MKYRGWVYQTYWMWRLGIPPIPLWLVGWFVIPFENYRPKDVRRASKRSIAETSNASTMPRNADNYQTGG
jgi:hypothetical protein